MERVSGKGVVYEKASFDQHRKKSNGAQKPNNQKSVGIELSFYMYVLCAVTLGILNQMLENVRYCLKDIRLYEESQSESYVWKLQSHVG